MKTLRGLGCEVIDMADLGHGVPDICVSTPKGRTFVAEIKAGDKVPSARKLTPDEVAFMKRWKGEYRVILSPSEAIKAVWDDLEGPAVKYD